MDDSEFRTGTIKKIIKTREAEQDLKLTPRVAPEAQSDDEDAQPDMDFVNFILNPRDDAAS